MSIERIKRIDRGGGYLKVTRGEYLVYTVTAQGSPAIFTLIDMALRKMLLSHEDLPNPCGNLIIWQRQWPTRADSNAVISKHMLGMHFNGPLKYNWVAEIHRNNGDVEKLLDIDFISTTSENFIMENFIVITA